MKKYRNYLILLNLVVVLMMFNLSIIDKESTLENGDLVLMKLAPVDPRSLMQGDYMRLDYEITRQIRSRNHSKRGYVVVERDEFGVAQLKRIQPNLTPKSNKEFLIPYTSNGRSSQFNIGAESYFFQEGTGKKYEAAKYGGLRLDKKGKSVLEGLYDKNFAQIK